MPIQEMIVIAIITAAVWYSARHLLKLVRRGDSESENCADCALMDAKLKSKMSPKT